MKRSNNKSIRFEARHGKLAGKNIGPNRTRVDEDEYPQSYKRISKLKK